MSDEEHIIDEGEVSHFSMIPHLIDDAPLSLAAFRLYCHYKRRAGATDEGRCWESTENIAKHLRVSKSTVTAAKKELCDWGLIKVTEISRGHGEFSRHEVGIGNIWSQNRQVYHGFTKERREAWLKAVRDGDHATAEKLRNEYMRLNTPGSHDGDGDHATAKKLEDESARLNTPGSCDGDGEGVTK